MGMEYKAFKVKFSDVAGEEGMFEGYASVFGNKDLAGDIMQPGAFKRTLQHTGGRVPILWQHDPNEPIGVGVSATEDAKGLAVRGQIDMNVVRGREARSLMKMGALGGLSIGYNIPKGGYEYKEGARHLTEVALGEWSPVTFPANTLARVNLVKGNYHELSETDLEKLANYLITKGYVLQAPVDTDDSDSHSDDEQPAPDADYKAIATLVADMRRTMEGNK